MLKRNLKSKLLFIAVLATVISMSSPASAGSVNNINEVGQNVSISNGSVSWSTSTIYLNGFSASKLSGSLAVISYIGEFAMAARTSGSVCSFWQAHFSDGTLDNKYGKQKFIGGAGGSIGGDSVKVSDLGYAPYGYNFILFVVFSNPSGTYVFYVAITVLNLSFNFGMLNTGESACNF